MRLPVSQQQLIGSVRDALRKYDAQLKDINTKLTRSTAHDHICALFDALGGYEVRRKAYGLNTALGIEYKHDSGGRVMVFNAEYDALPNIGHAYGHNLIVISSIAAFIATCEAMKIHGPEELGYTVRLLDTPAEESGGGKVRLLNNGAYELSRLSTEAKISPDN